MRASCTSKPLQGNFQTYIISIRDILKEGFENWPWSGHRGPAHPPSRRRRLHTVPVRRGLEPPVAERDKRNKRGLAHNDPICRSLAQEMHETECTDHATTLHAQTFCLSTERDVASQTDKALHIQRTEDASTPHTGRGPLASTPHKAGAHACWLHAQDAASRGGVCCHCQQIHSW